MKSFKLAVSIIRRSDVKQKENLSFEIQENEIKIRAEKEGYQIISCFRDDGISAYHKSVTKRRAMQEMLDTVLNSDLQIEAIFFYDESRLTRQFDDFTLFIYKVIKEQKPFVKFFSTSQDGEWNPYETISVINLANAAQESIKKSSRAKDAQKNLLKNETRPGSVLPYGYSKNEHGEQVPNEYAPIVNFIFFLTAWGHSQDKIANLLNDAKLVSPQNKKWSGNTIDYIINNDQYLGHLPWNIRVSRNTNRKRQRGEYDLINNHHEPIVSPLLWTLSHQAIDIHKQYGKNNETPFLLRNLIYCKSCDIILSAKDNTPSKSKKKYLIYKCPACKGSINIEPIHSAILEELLSKWSLKIRNIDKNIKKLLSRKLTFIKEYRNNLEIDLKTIGYNDDMLNSINVPSENTHRWDFILNVAKNKINQQILEANQFIETIDLLNQEENSLTLFLDILEKRNILNFKNAELRTLLLTLFKKISIDFVKGNHVAIEYKLSPFPEIENYLEKVE